MAIKSQRQQAIVLMNFGIPMQHDLVTGYYMFIRIFRFWSFGFDRIQYVTYFSD